MSSKNSSMLPNLSVDFDEAFVGADETIDSSNQLGILAISISEGERLGAKR
jgi:hypothetical protein